MISRRVTLPVVLLLVTLPAPVPAQDDGGGLIQRFLQDKLSSAGREVSISGFEGLLSGSARLAELTVADDEGVWLTLRDAVLDWNRTALLRGRLSVEELSAGEIILTRLPVADPTEEPEIEAPKAEASGFSLPNLPVAIRINTFAIERAELGEAVIGEAAILTLNGSVTLADGEGSVVLAADRLDGREDALDLEGGFVNETGVLTINLDFSEGEDGIVGNLLKLPGTPSVDLTIAGEGPLDNFAADIGLRTDGQDRVTGRVALTGRDDGGTGFDAEIGGDVTPLLPPEFHEFFGEDIRLVARGARPAAGGFDLDTLSLTSQSLSLKGNARIGADGLPLGFDLQGEVVDADGGAVRLPIAGPATTVAGVQLEARFDAAEDDEWTLDAALQDAMRGGSDIGRVTVTGNGSIDIAERAVTGDIKFAADGIALANQAITEAIGGAVSGGTSFSWEENSALDITALRVDGADYGLQVTGDARIGDGSLKLSGDGTLRADDLSRFSAISGQDLTGQVVARVAGSGDPLGGIFDVTLDLDGEGLSIGQEAADRLLAEPVTLDVAARRDLDGTTLDRFELRSRAVMVDASGAVGSGQSDIGFEASLLDVSLVAPQYEGALILSGDARETARGDWQVGLDLDGPYDLTGSVDGRVFPGQSDVTLDLSLPDIAPLVPGHSGAVTIAGRAAEEREGAWNVDLDVAGPYDLTAAVEGLVAPQDGQTDVAAKIDLPDIAPLAPGFTGAVNLDAQVSQTPAGGWSVDATGTGPYASDLDVAGDFGAGPGKVTLSAGLPDLSPIVPSLSGPFRADGTATTGGDGLWTIDFDTVGPVDARAKVDGVVGGGESDLTLDVTVPDLSPLVPQLQGPLTARATAAEAGDGLWDVDLTADGPYGASADAKGKVGATGTNVAANIAVPDIAPIVPGHRGALTASATAAQAEDGAWDLVLDASGPYSSAVNAEGTYGAGRSDLSFTAGLPDIAPLAPGLTGPLNATGAASETGDGAWNVDLDAEGPYRSTATVAGTVGAEGSRADLQLSIPSIAPFAPGITGGLEAQGSVVQDASGIAVDLSTRGPESASSSVTGTIAPDFSTMSLSATGSAPLGLANRALAPRAIRGTANFDLSVDGPPALQSVGGTVSVQNASMTLPTMAMSLPDIDATIGLNAGTVQINSSVAGPDGGSLDANGTIDLLGLNADISAVLNGFGVTDPLLYQTSLNGDVSFVGPLAGGAQIRGRIEVGRTEVRIPEGGLGFGGSVPLVTHLNEPAAVHLTRERAGLVVKDDGNGSGGGGGGGPAYGLDVRVVVPGEVFIRGRGLDTELGGAVVVTGTTASPNTVGEIEVLRGRLDILGRRLEVEEGTVSLAGGLSPYLDILATSSREDFEFQARLTGPVDDPSIALTSVPDLPNDEVLSYFLFGKSVTDLSALQAVQLASSLATLSGRGGPGVVGGLRDGLGLDDLDLTTGADGEAEVRAGKYLSDNIYTEFVADSDGDTEIDLNIDVSDTFTVKGTAASDGDSSIGIYWERDY